MDYTLPIIVLFSCTLTFVTVMVYERLLRDERAKNDELFADNHLFSELLNEALERHPSARPDFDVVRHLSIVDGGAK